MADDDAVKQALQEALLNDRVIDFRRVKDELRDGVCPSCGQRELYVSLAKPWRVQCRRANHCGYSESTRALYPEAFENLSRTYQATEANPNATADAYLVMNRGFDRKVIGGMYCQGHRKVNGGGTADTVRVPLPLCGDIHYWERLIDAESVRRNGGKKAHISYGCKYAGLGWVPPRMSFEKGDVVWITEGIFKSMALLHTGRKSLSSLSASNLPDAIIEQHKGKGITWVVALDHDHAGTTYGAKFLRRIREMGETGLAAYPDEGEDWDDAFRAGRLTDRYVQESLWRGNYLLADSALASAYFLYMRRKSFVQVFPFQKSLWRYHVDQKAAERELGENGVPDTPDWGDTEAVESFFPRFAGFTKLERISNCIPEFMYIERDALTEEQWYSFRFAFASGNPEQQVSLDGGSLDCPSSFNKSLLSRLPGATFDGTPKDLKALRDGWFNHKVSYVKTTPYCGYDCDTDTYIFPGFGYHGGQLIPENADGYIVAGRERLKCGLRGIGIQSVTEFDGAWIDDWKLAFGNNGMVLLSWWLGSLFAEQVRQKQQSWPFLEYTGEQGSGKSTQIEFLWRCIGRDHYEGFDPSKSTHAGRSRSFQQVANLPVVLLEGDRNSDMGSKRGVFDFDELKTAFNGKSIRAMGVKKRGAETEEPPFRGAILISQNAQVDGSDALLARIVYCHCTRGHFSSETEQAVRRLQSRDTKDVAGFLDRALGQAPKLLDGYFGSYGEVAENYLGQTQRIQNRVLYNHAQVAAWTRQLPGIFGKRVTEADCNAVEAYLWNRAVERHIRLRADHPMVDEFWSIFQFLNWERGRNEHGAACQMLNHSNTDGEIAISLPHFYELCRTYGQAILPERELKHLLPTSRKHAFIRQAKVRSRLWTQPVHCWIFAAKEDRESC